MALIELRSVSKIYHLGGEEIRALDNVDLDIDGGEFISIIARPAAASPRSCTSWLPRLAEQRQHQARRHRDFPRLDA